MLNEKYKGAAIRDLEKVNRQYNTVFERTIYSMEQLLRLRQRAVRQIQTIERYICALANKPRDYERKIGEVKIRYVAFHKRIEEIKNSDERQGEIAPIAVAMIFGTLSTSTAMALFSGSKAINTTLAWLPGSALAAKELGRGGIRTFSTVINPGYGGGMSGFGIVSIAVMCFMKSQNNQDTAKKAEETAKAIIRETERIREIGVKVEAWKKETIKLTNELAKKLAVVRRKKDYTLFTEAEKQELIILMNMTEVLSKKLGETV